MDDSDFLANLPGAVEVPTLDYWSSIKGDHATQKVLAELEAGSDPNALSPDGYSALHSAAGNGNLQTLKLLIDHGGDPNLTLADGTTPIDVAREEGHQQIVTFLNEREQERRDG